MTDECHNRPLHVDADELSSLRVELTAELAAELTPDVEPTRPNVAYTVAFGEHLDPSIRRRVALLYRAESRVHRRGAVAGHVYVFRDARDRPQSLVKIGRTSNVRRRMVQWRAALGADANDQDQVRLLFSFPTRHAVMAEALVHALLLCQWDAKRVNLLSGRRAYEYFDVRDWLALRQLVAVTTRHVDWWCGGGGDDDDDGDGGARRNR